MLGCDRVARLQCSKIEEKAQISAPNMDAKDYW